MSLDGIEQFIQQVQSDDSLGKEFLAALEGEGPKDAVVKLAQSRGFEFDSVELVERLPTLQKIGPSEELSDEQLDAVSGGFLVIGGVALAWGIATHRSKLQFKQRAYKYIGAYGHKPPSMSGGFDANDEDNPYWK